ncbi:GNAT family N-acetyltransferase [Actinoplanes sp. NPDC051470]|uniref:GNAT family N-acetyltransferase n=1 Tax=unclassified Actinoplanes TaxID=2626549 RepID=UPI00343886C9
MIIRSRFPVDDAVLSALHSRAFGVPVEVKKWSSQLNRHALTWLGAFDAGDELIGFVQVAWDGGGHAFILDTAVDPAAQGRGVGAALVRTAAAEAKAAGCDWLHVDYEPHLDHFYRDRCGFRPTQAGLISLDSQAT